MTKHESSPVEPNVTDRISESAHLTYEEMYKRYFAGMVIRASHYGVRDPEGTVQEVFIKALNKYSSPEDKGKVNGTWLYRALATTAIDEIRKSQRRPLDLESELSKAETLQYMGTPDEHAQDGFDDVELQDTLRQTRKILDARSQHWYDMVFRRIILTEQYNEISRDMGIPENSVKTGVFRSLKALRDDDDYVESLTSN